MEITEVELETITQATTEDLYIEDSTMSMTYMFRRVNMIKEIPQM